MKGPGGRGEVEVAVSGVAGSNFLSGFSEFCNKMLEIFFWSNKKNKSYKALLNIHQVKQFSLINVCFVLHDCTLTFFYQSSKYFQRGVELDT